MKDIVRKGDDFLSAEETLSTILWDMGLVKDVENVLGDKVAKTTADCVIEVRRIRNNGDKGRK